MQGAAKVILRSLQGAATWQIYHPSTVKVLRW